MVTLPRILSKPWHADPALRDLTQSVVMGSKSVVQLISNSQEFSSWFARNVSHMGESVAGKVRNLRAAKHRFETFSKPLARLILFLPAFLVTAQEIAGKRDDKPEGKAAAAWLAALTPANLVLLAMLADAGDEGLGLIRAADNEAVDIADMQEHVTNFLRNIETLFDRGNAVTTDSFTKHCIGYLKGDGVPLFYGDSVRMIGEANETDLRKCFDRMKCWATLAREVVAAEYPDHDLFVPLAFSMCQLQGRLPVWAPMSNGWQKCSKLTKGSCWLNFWITARWLEDA